MQISDEQVELKPCPFCGGPARSVYAHAGYGINRWRVWCDACVIATPQFDNEPDAIEAWNLRAALSLPVQPVAWEPYQIAIRIGAEVRRRNRVGKDDEAGSISPCCELAATILVLEALHDCGILPATTPPVPPTKGPEELAEIERMLNEGQGDDDGMQIMPDFDEGMSTLAKVETCLHLLEKRRDVIAAYVADENWRDDPSADERWNAGLDFGMSKLCAYLGVDPAAVTWDAATETLDGDVCAVIGNILRAKYGDDLGPLSRIATKGPEDDLIAAREAAEDIEINYVVCDPKEVREQVAAAIVDALRKDRALRSRSVQP